MSGVRRGHAPAADSLNGPLPDMDPTSSADRDVATAGQPQRMLLPPQSQTIGEWSTALHYEPAGVVSGDYVDIMSSGDRLYFRVGDVSATLADPRRNQA